ncbi:translin family protein [Phocaeicola vulgatus]|nr:translin family protein [Phocaeicola vulgatus]MCB5705864.1 translin family protein [Phocaeicola vulgatus]MCB6496743.1 translin family protein [Phocaeicola vulgatus]MCB6512279.1 translin family protein [Phocaeicola vulgatus]MCB6640405.1 translin family protein [Phocaeicola vulgatus]
MDFLFLFVAEITQFDVSLGGELLGVSQKVGDDLGEAHTVYVYGHILVGKFFDEFHWRENNYLMGLIDRFGEMMRAAILAMKGHIAGFYTG